MSIEEFTHKELDKIKLSAMEVTFESSIKKNEADTNSHIGGKPYLIEGDDWPICLSCKQEMEFFLQLREINSDKSVSLKTFYQCDCKIEDYIPIISIKEYMNPEPSRIDHTRLENKECKDYTPIKLDPYWSAPNWSFLKYYNKDLFDGILKAFDNDEEQADAFYDEQRLFNDFLPEDPFTILYGYPEFYSDPPNSFICNCCGNPVTFYFQIDSLQKQKINWNDGTLYCYFCPKSKTYFFYLN